MTRARENEGVIWDPGCSSYGTPVSFFNFKLKLLHVIMILPEISTHLTVWRGVSRGVLSLGLAAVDNKGHPAIPSCRQPGLLQKYATDLRVFARPCKTFASFPALHLTRSFSANPHAASRR